MTTANPPTRRPRGRIDKRRDLIAAAFRVFAAHGYMGSCVEQIAAEAGTAKPTLYAHFGDKETLFREAVAEVARAAMDKSLAVVGDLDPGVADLAAALTDIGVDLLDCYRAEDSWALRRLVNAELVRFPDLVRTVLGGGAEVNRVTGALADRFSRLVLAGRLARCEPDEAAEQFVALLTGPMEARSALGTRPVPDAEVRRVAASAVRTFLLAYGAEAAGPRVATR
ncbi:TetR/AcrR family transcriptional regulator [Actinokineospora auranticolor]|uniref:AefR-like transcriptional repressor n=1 Tax=Actinokineospora auranticolor TaxID=155976 RepID=A0A2S6GLX6_9PSEU|nr:TetR/AcrR family transcriptional regulator [Actinokineospora auranticolor]PPK66173.1 AefR-like transcriptional repressor [Actinokineospora auranticolor]